MVRTPSGEGSPEPRQAEAARTSNVALVAGSRESIDDRLEALGGRLEAVERLLREHAARPAGEAHGEWSKERREQSIRPAVDSREAVDEGLRALTAGRRESDPADAE